MKKFFYWLNNRLEEDILILLMIGISCTMFLQVIMRYVFNMPLTWPEEISRYMWIWTVFFSLSFTVYRRSLLRVDVIAEFLPSHIKDTLNLAIQILSLVIYSVFFYYSLIVYRSLIVSGRVSPALRIPMYLVYSVVCIGFFLSIIRTLQVMYEIIQEMCGKKTEHAKMIEEMQKETQKEGI